MSSQSVQSAPFVIADGLNALILSISMLTSFFGLLILLNPLLAGLVLLSVIPYLLIHLRFGKDRFKISFDLSPLQRQLSYLSLALTGLKMAKEIRLFGLQDYLFKKWRHIAKQSNETQRKQQRKEEVLSKVVDWL